MPTQRVMVYAGANDPVNDPEGLVPAALANRGCCQQSETTNICMDEEYPTGACVPLAGRTIDCANGHWNPNAQYSQGFCVNGITLPLDGVESCDARVAVRMTAYGGNYEIDIGTDALTIVRTDDPANWDEFIDFGCVAHPVITDERALELDELRATLHRDLSDVERWCFKDLERCTLSIQHETLWRTEVINITDTNATAPEPEPEPEDGGRRLQEEEGAAGEGAAGEGLEGGGAEGENNATMTIHIPIGKMVNVTLNISGGSLTTFDNSEEALFEDMALLQAIFPRMYEAVRHTVRPDTLPIDLETVSAADIDASRGLAAPEPEPEPVLNATDPEPEPEPEPEPLAAAGAGAEEEEEGARVSTVSFARFIAMGLSDQLLQIVRAPAPTLRRPPHLTTPWASLAGASLPAGGARGGGGELQLGAGVGRHVLRQPPHRRQRHERRAVRRGRAAAVIHPLPRHRPGLPPGRHAGEAPCAPPGPSHAPTHPAKSAHCDRCAVVVPFREPSAVPCAPIQGGPSRVGDEVQAKRAAELGISKQEALLRVHTTRQPRTVCVGC